MPREKHKLTETDVMTNVSTVKEKLRQRFGSLKHRYDRLAEFFDAYLAKQESTNPKGTLAAKLRGEGANTRGSNAASTVW